jgi:hypothetical protein
MVHYAPDVVILCRMFDMHGQRLSLTAVSNDPRLTPVALDPALTTIETALSAASKSRLQIAADEVRVR